MSEAPTSPPLERDALIAEAKKRTGLSDIGDTWFYEPLDLVLKCANGESRLSETGKIYQSELMVSYLSNRLKMVDLLKRHPEIHDEKVEVAAAIISLARTGSTKTHRMLGAAPGHTTMAWWECNFPIPFPGEERGNPVGLCRRGDIEGCASVPGDDVRVRAVLEEEANELEPLALVQVMLAVHVADLRPRCPVERWAARDLPLIAKSIDRFGILAKPRLDVLA